MNQRLDEASILKQLASSLLSSMFLQEVYRNSMPASTFQQQKLRVCEVCSAYLGLHDNDRRLADHFGGKLHLGFIEIREKLEKLRVSCAGAFVGRLKRRRDPRGLLMCAESGYGEAREDADAETRGTGKRGAGATVGDGAGAGT